MESIYDRTRPSLFTEIEVIKYNELEVLAIKVVSDGNTYATTDGKCLKRLGKNSKPYYPDEMSNKYSTIQNPDFSSQIVVESSLDDVAFMRDLGLIKADGDIYKLTIAGLLFVGKETSIYQLLPQGEKQVDRIQQIPDKMEKRCAEHSKAFGVFLGNALGGNLTKYQHHHGGYDGG